MSTATKSKIPVVIRFQDDTEESVEVVSLPWTYKTFLVVDDGGPNLRYIPLTNVESVSAPRN